jgi:hypothetical protein
VKIVEKTPVQRFLNVKIAVTISVMFVLIFVRNAEIIYVIAVIKNTTLAVLDERDLYFSSFFTRRD